MASDYLRCGGWAWRRVRGLVGVVRALRAKGWCGARARVVLVDEPSGGVSAVNHLSPDVAFRRQRLKTRRKSRWPRETQSRRLRRCRRRHRRGARRRRLAARHPPRQRLRHAVGRSGHLEIKDGVGATPVKPPSLWLPHIDCAHCYDNEAEIGAALGPSIRRFGATGLCRLETLERSTNGVTSSARSTRWRSCSSTTSISTWCGRWRRGPRASPRTSARADASGPMWTSRRRAPTAARRRAARGDVARDGGRRPRRATGSAPTTSTRRSSRRSTT